MSNIFFSFSGWAFSDRTPTALLYAEQSVAKIWTVIPIVLTTYTAVNCTFNLYLNVFPHVFISFSRCKMHELRLNKSNFEKKIFKIERFFFFRFRIVARMTVKNWEYFKNCAMDLNVSRRQSHRPSPCFFTKNGGIFHLFIFWGRSEFGNFFGKG